jgi:hypothetical protein
VAATLAVPASAAAQASLTVDPVAPCYREREGVFLRGAGFTPNAVVNFMRDGISIVPEDPIEANPSGQFFPQLDLPGLLSGQRHLTYVATDSTNPAISAQVRLLVTATDVGLKPEGGPPHRLLTVRARGFFRGTTLYAHVVRAGPRPGRARNLRIGPVKGACKRVKARTRLFRRDTRPGRYRVQFDTFRTYRANRTIETDFKVTVYRTADAARATALTPAS